MEFGTLSVRNGCGKSSAKKWFTTHSSRSGFGRLFVKIGWLTKLGIGLRATGSL